MRSTFEWVVSCTVDVDDFRKEDDCDFDEADSCERKWSIVSVRLLGRRASADLQERGTNHEGSRNSNLRETLSAFPSTKRGFTRPSLNSKRDFAESERCDGRKVRSERGGAGIKEREEN